MSDNDNDGGISIREEQKPSGRPQGTPIELNHLKGHGLSNEKETKKKIDLIDDLLKEIDPDYKEKRRYSRIVIVEKDNSDDSKKAKRKKIEYEVGAKVLSMGKLRWFKSTRSSLENAVNDVYIAIKEEAHKHMIQTEGVEVTDWWFHELWPKQKGSAPQLDNNGKIAISTIQKIIIALDNSQTEGDDLTGQLGRAFMDDSTVCYSATQAGHGLPYAVSGSGPTITEALDKLVAKLKVEQKKRKESA